MDRKKLGWLAVIVILLAIVLAGAGSVWARYRDSATVEIQTTETPIDFGQVYLGGAVTAPGWYTLRPGDTLADLIAAAGGVLPGADASQLSLTIGESTDNLQRININTAEAWLLAALPGIGETKAQAIVDYRQANGPFLGTAEIMDVPGIGEGLYEDVRDLITVGE